MSERVFAYGSNMCSGRFRDYGVVPENAGRAAVLVGYCLVFNKFSQRDGSGKANVEQSEDTDVWGVVYSIPNAELPILDRGEGPGYRRQQLALQTQDKENIDAWVYMAVRPRRDASLRPYSWYKRFLVEGAKEHALPAAYIAELEHIEALEDPDVRRDRDKRALACGERQGQ